MPLIPIDTLRSADKILFITHLAIGDFTYLHNFFSAFAKAYPHLKIDLWVDEVRRTADPKQWPFLKKYSLYDWVEYCPFFHRVYRHTYSPDLFKESINHARQEDYSIVVSLATLRAHQYAKLAREVGPDAFVVGIKNKVAWFEPWKHLAYRNLDCYFKPFSRTNHDYHITDVYADWFDQLCGLQLTQHQRFPLIDIPPTWQQQTQRQLQEWRIADQKRVFINTYAKTKKRCWPLKNVVTLINTMRQLPAWKNTAFIINTIPEEKDNARSLLAPHQLKAVSLFSAEDNFFQLPAMLQHCDLIISVETAVMHLANAVHVPVIALMRQKNPEWVPIDCQNSTIITTQKRSDWVDAITVDQISQVLLK